MRDTTKVILAVLGGIIIGARLQAIVDLKKIAILKQDIDSLKASENEAWKERDECVKEADELRQNNIVLQHRNDVQGMTIIAQQREIKQLKGQLYN